MGTLVYDVAASLDGYIAGPDNDVASFPHVGDHVDAYIERLKTYNTVVMGRKTYEFAYSYGLKPGDLAYPDMSHIVVSATIELPASSEIKVVQDLGELVSIIDRLKTTSDSDIYLCGGGQLAGHLLTNNCIDTLHVKLAPIVLGSGTPIFGSNCQSHCMDPLTAVRHTSGVTTLSYNLKKC